MSGGRRRVSGDSTGSAKSAKSTRSVGQSRQLLAYENAPTGPVRSPYHVRPVGDDTPEIESESELAVSDGVVAINVEDVPSVPPSSASSNRALPVQSVSNPMRDVAPVEGSSVPTAGVVVNVEDVPSVPPSSASSNRALPVQSVSNPMRDVASVEGSSGGVSPGQSASNPLPVPQDVSLPSSSNGQSVFNPLRGAGSVSRMTAQPLLAGVPGERTGRTGSESRVRRSFTRNSPFTPGPAAAQEQAREAAPKGGREALEVESPASAAGAPSGGTDWKSKSDKVKRPWCFYAVLAAVACVVAAVPTIAVPLALQKNCTIKGPLNGPDCFNDASVTPTSSMTETGSASFTQTTSLLLTSTQTLSQTESSSQDQTASQTQTLSFGSSSTQASTPTPTQADSPTQSSTSSGSPSVSASQLATATQTASLSVSGTSSPSGSSTPSASPIIGMQASCTLAATLTCQSVISALCHWVGSLGGVNTSVSMNITSVPVHGNFVSSQYCNSAGCLFPATTDDATAQQQIASAQVCGFVASTPIVVQGYSVFGAYVHTVSTVPFPFAVRELADDADDQPPPLELAIV